MPIHRVTKPSPGAKAGPKVRGKTRSTPRARGRRAAKKKSNEAALRAARVARGKRLIEDPNYPSPAVIQSVARLLARNAEIADDNYL